MTRRTALAIIGATASTHLRAAAPAIEVGPDKPIGDLAATQGEPCIAAHPTDPNRLLVSACDFAPGDFSNIRAVAYATLDAGQTWTKTTLQPGANNWVAYSSNGTAYFVANPVSPSGSSTLLLYRSSDSGRTWRAPETIPGNGFDQPRIIADKNKLFITAARAGIVVIRSADAGENFDLITIAPNNLGNQPTNPLILADGSLVVPFADFPNYPDAQPVSSRIWILRSTDDGKTFDHPHFIADVPRPWPGGGVEIAASHDRLFAIWDSGDFGGRVLSSGANFKQEEVGNRRDLAIAYSMNNGKTWSKPRQIEQPGLGPAFMGSIDVAPNGTIGLFWIRHERYETNPKTYRTWFAASTDNGESLTQPTVVSTAVSNPNQGLLTKIDYLAHRPRGGDYIRVVAAADSSFHAVWSDARDGQFRVHHARIRVTV